jgi:hypothetical protein
MIFCYFKPTGPEGIAPFPPSIYESEWASNLRTYLQSKGHTSENPGFLLENETELNQFLDTFKVTDSTLLADIATWKEAHGITYVEGYYNLTDTGGTQSIMGSAIDSKL